MSKHHAAKHGLVSHLGRPAEAFILGGAILSLLGWVLALLHQLKVGPYAAGLIISVGIGIWFAKQWIEPQTGKRQLGFSRIRRRLRRPVFVIYTLIFLASLIGGILYAPSNYDALSYRTPQLLHWLDHGGWHWIATPNSRMNIASPGSNWLAAPMIILLGTDRVSFVVNVLGFALMPGFVFGMLRGAGVAPRVAWWWMWLIPSAYVFATQAGGLGNDLTGTVYSVAAISFALRAREKGRFSDAALSLLAVAMCTGIKNSNLPIFLPWAVALGRSGWRSFAVRPGGSVAAVVLAVFASCLPTTVLNIRQTGHWTGDPHDEHRVRQPNPWVGATSNAVLLAVANLQPPVWPLVGKTNNAFNRAVEAVGLREFFQQSPRFEVKWYEIPSEEAAGVGLGLVGIASISVVGTALFWRRGTLHSGASPKRWDVGIASLAAMLIPISLVSSEGLPRLIAVFIPSTLILVLLGVGNQKLIRSRAWRVAAVAAACFALPALVLSAARPLFPQRLLLGGETDLASQSGISARARRVYSIYANRPDAFAPIRRFLPPGTSRIGEIAFGDEPETSLWRPFGSISVRHLLAGSNVTDETAIVASAPVTRSRFGVSVEEFARAHGFEISGSIELSLRASGNPELWYVLVRKP